MGWGVPMWGSPRPLLVQDLPAPASCCLSPAAAWGCRSLSPRLCRALLASPGPEGQCRCSRSPARSEGSCPLALPSTSPVVTVSALALVRVGLFVGSLFIFLFFFFFFFFPFVGFFFFFPFFLFFSFFFPLATTKSKLFFFFSFLS